MKRALALSGAAAAVIGTTLFVAPPAAQADECVGGSSSGKCVQVLSTSVSTSVVETVPMQNNSGTTASFTCGFSQTISRSVETSASAELSVSAQVAAVGASASVGVSESVNQSASEASSAGGTVTLAPGESILCERTYSAVTAQMREYSYSGTGTTETARYQVTVPSSLGIRLS
ncbi:hypothetical protein QE364_003292 [Nocardioides zeae]|uniref:Uncharacterized protein n=2 Tax=Nocardioides zeae TaxID=1457234 RepID=A0AAJ1U6F0_9ACTN|nr:hypothetical protein [Nocardioides zeae]MDQ1106443.1 hypothetical protein [Nocardioides zeae]MDR6173876.1 hypothetical protein [Nocardioides zeae]MDR6211568.1 hypothetical protein [Nocardioides zeae]